MTKLGYIVWHWWAGCFTLIVQQTRAPFAQTLFRIGEYMSWPIVAECNLQWESIEETGLHSLVMYGGASLCSPMKVKTYNLYVCNALAANAAGHKELVLRGRACTDHIPDERQHLESIGDDQLNKLED